MINDLIEGRHFFFLLLSLKTLPPPPPTPPVEKKNHIEAPYLTRGASASSGFHPSPQHRVATSSETGMAPRLAAAPAQPAPAGCLGCGAEATRAGGLGAPLTLTFSALSPAPCLSASTLLPRCSTPSAGPTPTSPWSPRACWELSAAPLPSWLESRCASGRRFWTAPWKRYNAARRGPDLEPGRPGSGSHLCC